MPHENIKQLFSAEVASVSSNISEHVVNPQKDFTRSSARGVYSIHLNAFYDFDRHT